MKLNNHGWGLREMIFFSAVLLLFLLLVVILIMQLYNELDESINAEPVVNTSTEINEEYYRNKEYAVREAARLYIQEMGTNLGSGSVNIYIDELINGGYLNYFGDQITGDYCDGYARVYEEFGIMYIDGYIKCDNYKTEGYVG